MRILLAGNIFSEGSTSLFALKALQELGHSVFVWDNRVKSNYNFKDIDVSIAWSTEILASQLPDSKKILIYLDDTNFWLHHNPLRSVEAISNDYDYVYCTNKINGYSWMPMGCDPDIHKKLDTKIKYDVVFLGTCRDEERRKLIMKLKDQFRLEGISFMYFGNNWDEATRPAYFHDFARICSSAKIVLNQHYDLSPSTKPHEIACVGGGMLLNDNKEGFLNCYPLAPVYDNLNDCLKKVNLYLKNQDKRIRATEYMQARAMEFSYIEQIGKILERIE